jgi:lambda family phage minor tail protein L
MRYALVGYYQGTGYVVGDEFELIFSELQSASPSAIIELFQLELNAAQHGADITYYFHTGTQEGTGAPIVFDGESYIPLPVQAEGFAYDGKGSLPRPTLAVSNLFNVISGLIATLPAGLEGAKVTRIRTLAKFLDAVNFASGVNATADPSAMFPLEVYFVDRKSAETRSIIEFELASVFDLAGVRSPKRSCLNMCQWVYKSAECGYDPTVGPGKTIDGTNFTRFNINDDPVLSDSEDICGKRLSSCQCRFGENADLPYGGFPSIGSYYS